MPAVFHIQQQPNHGLQLLDVRLVLLMPPRVVGVNEAEGGAGADLRLKPGGRTHVEAEHRIVTVNGGAILVVAQHAAIAYDGALLIYSPFHGVSLGENLDQGICDPNTNGVRLAGSFLGVTGIFQVLPYVITQPLAVKHKASLKLGPQAGHFARLIAMISLVEHRAYALPIATEAVRPTLPTARRTIVNSGVPVFLEAPVVFCYPIRIAVFPFLSVELMQDTHATTVLGAPVLLFLILRRQCHWTRRLVAACAFDGDPARTGQSACFDLRCFVRPWRVV
mmetsp:Transcript_21379/g.38041  ORF Transcript_21379/g.38041 Transcript_21379/m.38041 type:complete len:279 (+) Transcript_21379:667-1503(+)